MKPIPMLPLAGMLALIATFAGWGDSTQAGWIDLSSAWQSQGLGSSWGLVSDPVTGTVYAFNNQSAKRLNTATNTWTNLTSAPHTAYTHGDNNTMVFYTDGKFIMRGHLRDYLSIYDTTANSWTEVQIPTQTYGHSWSQGSIYNPYTKTMWVFWTTWGVADMVEAGYNLETGQWTTPTPIDYGSNVHKFHNSKPGLIIGNYYYHLNTQTDQNVTMQRVRLDNWTDPVNAVLEDLASVNLGAQLGQPDPGSSWGDRILGASGDNIFVTGVDWSGVFAVYNISSNTWTVLPNYPNLNTPGGYRDHSMVIGASLIPYSSMIYVQDGNQFWALAIPEPGSGVLLGIGLVGLLAGGCLFTRRKRENP